MIQIDNTLVSLDVLERKFCCDIPLCNGMCCHYGDSGAPLEEEEAEYLEKHLRKLEPFLRDEGLQAIQEKGSSLTDSDGDVVTPLIGNEECAYALLHKGVYSCGIEKAWEAGKSRLRKPLSCHLFPIRIKRYRDYEAVNYDKWEICKPARALGEREGLPVYVFLKEALVRKYGNKWYSQLELAAAELRQQGLIR